jgi:hypothetical protein
MNKNRKVRILRRGIQSLFSFSFSFFFIGMGFELRALCFQSRCSSTWATCPVHFVLVILKMGLSKYFPGLASNPNPPDLRLPKYRYESPHWWYWSLNSGPGTCYIGVLLLEPHPETNLQFLITFFFLHDWSLNLGLLPCKAGTLNNFFLLKCNSCTI